MITGLSLDQSTDFVSEFDPDREKPDGNPTKFKLMTLDSRVMGHLRDLATKLKVNPNAGPDDDVETTVAMNEVAFQTVQFGCGGAAPFDDQDGNDIPWRTMKRNLGGKSYEIASDTVINRLPLRVISELAVELRKINNLGEDEGNE